MKSGVILLVLVATAALGCQAAAPSGALPHGVVGEEMSPPRIVGWRLVERTYGQADPRKGVAGDGEIPGPSSLLIYEPVFEEVRTREFGALKIRTGCEHEIRLRIVGSLSRSVGDQVTAECRIEGPDALYHELSIEPTSGGIDILEVRGAARGIGKPGRYLIPGNRVFEVVFTSHLAGRGTVTISVLREVGQDPQARSAGSRAQAPGEQ
jgi:hypothetical protein